MKKEHIKDISLEFLPLYENSDSDNPELNSDIVNQAIDALRAKNHDDESIQKVAKALFGKFVLLKDSPYETIKQNVKMFISKSKKFGIVPIQDDDNEIFEAFEERHRNLIKEFIRLYLDFLYKTNETIRENSIFRTYYKSIKTKRNRNDNRFERPENIRDLTRQYTSAGRDFVAHTCQVSYKLLSKVEKDDDMKELAKKLSSDEYSTSDQNRKYIKDIKSIDERMHIDSAAMAVMLAKRNQETEKNLVLPYSAASTKEAISLADKYKKQFPKYYGRAHRKLSDAYEKGIKEAKADLKQGKSLEDPLSGESVNSELLAPIWQAGSKLNKFFTNEPWNSVTLFPKLLFGTFNMLTSDTAKNIYSGIAGFVRKFSSGTDNEESNDSDNSNYWNVNTETLSNEFDSYVVTHTNNNGENSDE